MIRSAVIIIPEGLAADRIADDNSVVTKVLSLRIQAPILNCLATSAGGVFSLTGRPPICGSGAVNCLA
jgi:hypothetical protein